MLVELKIVKHLKNDWYGSTEIVGRHRAIIKISESKCSKIGDFAMTLLHEFLHLWLLILKNNGAKVDLRKDHRFIYAIEKSVSDIAIKTFKRRIKHGS